MIPLDTWVIIWVRPHTEYPTITSNINDEKSAREMARLMLDSGKTDDLIVCSVKELRNVRAVFRSGDIDRDRACCDCGESYTCDLSMGSGDDPVHCPMCRVKPKNKPRA